MFSAKYFIIVSQLFAKMFRQSDGKQTCFLKMIRGVFAEPAVDFWD